MDEDPLARLGAELRRWREASRLTQSGLAARMTGWDRESTRTIISKCERGWSAPSKSMLAAFDRELGAGGALVALLATARTRQPGTVEVARSDSASTDREEAATNRRNFLELGALSALALQTQQSIDSGEPDIGTLDEIDSDVDEIAVLYGSAPHAQLLPQVAGRWRQLGTMLDGYVSLKTRPRVLELRGQFSYFLGRLAFNSADMRSARRFAGLASRYADEVGEPVLILSIAALRSSIAYWSKRYTTALTVLEEVGRTRHPYMDARIAAYRARAYGALGDVSAARLALSEMERTAGSWAPMPGSTPVGEAGVGMFRAGVGVVIGDLGMAREWAAIAVDRYARRGGDYSVEEAQHAELTYAMTHLLGPQPDPAAAAAMARGIVDSNPTHTVLTKAANIRDRLAPRYHGIPEVAAFADALGHRGLALPAATS